MQQVIAALCERLKVLDRDIWYRQTPSQGEAWFKTVVGTRPVLLSAPHGCAHLRSGLLKMEEEFTSAIARHLAETKDCHAIYLWRQADEDPNWTQQSRYKDVVAKLVAQHDIQFVLDLHGMINRHQMGVALGTMRGRSCPGLDVSGIFASAGFVRLDAELLAESGVPMHNRLVVDHPRFTGGIRNHTVTRFAVEQLGIMALQVEIASINRVVYSPPTEGWPYEYIGEPTGIAAVVRALGKFIDSISDTAAPDIGPGKT